MKDYLPAVCIRSLPTQQLRALHAVHHLDSTVMPELHALREFADCGFPAGWKSAHREQKEILLRLETRGAGRLLAAVQKLSDLIPEFRQRAKFDRAHRVGHFRVIVSDQDRDANHLRRYIDRVVTSPGISHGLSERQEERKDADIKLVKNAICLNLLFGVEKNCHWAVVYQFHFHMRSKYPGFDCDSE
jgi:hypothetical protein